MDDKERITVLCLDVLTCNSIVDQLPEETWRIRTVSEGKIFFFVFVFEKWINHFTLAGENFQSGHTSISFLNVVEY